MDGINYVRKKMPMIGLGTYLIKDEEGLRIAIDTALDSGYRFIDTAQVYRNEEMVGNALKDLLPKYQLTRDQIFITSKLDPKNSGPKAYENVCKSVEALGAEYIDLFLVHWPGRSGYPIKDKRNKDARKLAWQGLEKAYNEGLVRAIGISNFQPNHLDELMEYANVHPAVNQCEFHPAYCPQDVLESCKNHGILFQAYSSFGSTGNQDLLQHEPYIELAEKYECSVPQLLLAWSIFQGYSVLPKSTNPDHIRANFKAIDVKLEAEDVEKMKWATQKKFCWNPTSVA
jgi:diketogulonate reductase-like aldo/keto reductase